MMLPCSIKLEFINFGRLGNSESTFSLKPSRNCDRNYASFSPSLFPLRRQKIMCGWRSGKVVGPRRIAGDPLHNFFSPVRVPRPAAGPTGARCDRTRAPLTNLFDDALLISDRCWDRNSITFLGTEQCMSHR